MKGSEQIGFTIISLTFSLIAVLIPLLFMGDVVGRLFREFAITLAVAILISAVVSLTLTPMMCARLLKHVPENEQGRFYRASGRFFERVIKRYGEMLEWVLDRQGATLLVAVGTLVLTVLLYLVVPKGFFPLQDTGAIQAVTEAPQSISFTAMAERQRAMAEALLEDPAVESLSSFIGVDGANATLNSGRMLINLKDKGARDGVAAVIRRLNERARKVQGIALYLQPVQDLSIETRISRTQFQFTVEDANPDELSTWVPKLVARLETLPQLADVASDLQDRGLQAYVNVDRDSAARLGITMLAVDNALYNAFGQRLISTIFTQANQYRVVLEVKPEFQKNPVFAERPLRRLRERPAGAARLDRHRERASRLARRDAHRPAAGLHHLLQPRRRRLAGRGGRGDPRRRARDRPAAERADEFPGRGARLPGLARQHAPADPRRDRHDVHRAGRALRELHPSRDDPVDAAVGGDRRAARADRLAQRTRPHRGDRHHPADRHRQEERDHDDRLRARCREERGQERARGDLPGLPAALPADPDDHAVGALERPAADAWAAAWARNCASRSASPWSAACW